MHLRFLSGIVGLFFLLVIVPFKVAGENITDYSTLKSLLNKTFDCQKTDILIKLSKAVDDTAQDLAFLYAFKALHQAVRCNDDKGRAESRILIGNYFVFKRKYMQALEFYLAALNISNKNQNNTGILEACRAIGNLNYILRNYTDALIFFQKGLNLAKVVHELAWTGIFLQHIGNIWQQQGKLDDASGCYNEAIHIFTKLGQPGNTMSVINSKGSILLDKGRYDEAIDLYNHLLEANDPVTTPYRGTFYSMLAHAYSQKNNYIKALYFNKKAFIIRQLLYQSELKNSSLINIAGNYFILNKPDSAWLFMKEGIDQARQAGRKNLIENAYLSLFHHYDWIKDYQKALFYYKELADIRDTILIYKNEGNIAIIAANQRIRSIKEANILLSRQNEIQTLNLKNQQFQINLLRVLTSLTAIMIVIYYAQYLKNIRRKKEMQRINAQMSKEIKDRETAQKQLCEREQHYRFLTENTIDFITRLDKNKNRLFASPSSTHVYGYTPAEILTKNPYDLTHPDFYEFSETTFKEMIKQKKSKQIVYLAIKKNGESFWAESTLNPIFDKEKGELLEIIGVTRDIQERKRKEIEIMEGTKQKENLLKEIHHRVKNNFAILVSLINMQKDQTNNPELIQSLTNLQLRIRTMALVHEMLYRSKDFEKISFSDYLRSLAMVITGTFNRKNIQIVFEIEDITMDIETSIPLGLIVNEILSNAYKHAFPPDRTGIIRIHLKTFTNPTKYVLTIRDDGIGIPAGFSIETCKTMGLQIVQILVKQLEGHLTLVNDPGVNFTIIFPNA